MLPFSEGDEGSIKPGERSAGYAAPPALAAREASMVEVLSMIGFGVIVGLVIWFFISGATDE